VETELRAGGGRATVAIRLLRASAAHMQAVASRHPEGALLCMTFLATVARRAPLALAAGCDAGALPAAAAATAAALPSRQAASARKLSLELVSCLGAALPAAVLQPRSLRRLSCALASRAVDVSLDIASRVHASQQLAELLDSCRVWSGAPEEEAWAEYTRASGALLSALPEAGTSKQLTSRLLLAATSLLRGNPWAAGLDFEQLGLDRSGEQAPPANLPVPAGEAHRRAWLLLVHRHFPLP